VTLAKRLVAEDKVSVIDIDLPSSANIAVHVVSKEMKVVQLTGLLARMCPTRASYHFRSAPGRSPHPVLAIIWRLFPTTKRSPCGPTTTTVGRLASLIGLQKLGKPEVVYEAYYERNQTDFNTSSSDES